MNRRVEIRVNPNTIQQPYQRTAPHADRATFPILHATGLCYTARAR
jgi:hypothetical protein